MANDFEITGKKKLVIDESGYYNAKRTGPSNQEFSFLSPEIRDDYVNGTYFNSPEKVDKVRVVTGKNWDYHVNVNDPKLANNWPPFNSFAGKPIEIVPCGDPYNSLDDPNQTGIILDQEVMLKGTFPASIADVPWHAATPSYCWIGYIKTGVEDRNPIVKAGNHYFNDHFHETYIPFTPDEIATKQPLGKAYYADYKTYYNERLDSIKFEKTMGSRENMQNSLPNIYGFLRLAKNKFLLANETFELSKLINYIDSWLPGIPGVHGASLTLDNVYKDLFQKYPLETLTTLYGAIHEQTDSQLNPGTWVQGQQLIEKIINFDFSKHDASGLFEQYFDTFSGYLEYYSQHEFRYVDAENNKLKALENIMSNIAFSSNFISIMDKVDQYKNYFPYYVDLNFTAKTKTAVGDLTKQLFMTRFLSYKMLASTNNTAYPEYNYTYGIADNSWNKENKFVEYYDEKTYVNFLPAGSTGTPEVEYSEHTLTEPKEKNILDINTVLANFADPEHELTYGPWPHLDLYDTAIPGTETAFFRDIRNFITFVRDDFKDPVDFTEENNTVFKTLCGTALQLKILDLYKKNRRDYFDIMNGMSAYTEDLFYKIVKWKKKKGETEWTKVQNILLPNTSELSVARYVDTQLKYSDYATYKYDVYTMRIVFGSKYKYLWGKSSDQGFDVGEQEFDPLAIENAGAPPQGVSLLGPSGNEVWDGISYPPQQQEDNTYLYTAKFLVRVEPSIQVIEDKLFSTPEVFIMDRPPMPPDINIIPYRAVNNKLKFLFNGTTGRAKEKPVIILESDKQKFDLVKKSQLISSPKDSSAMENQAIEFANDDPVNRFQIFRIRDLPTSYAEFELYQNNVTSVFEETILPNTKYYYTFRSIDDHNHISNPSPVYQVELIDEKGAVKPIIKIISIEPKEPITYIKDCQKYIYIKPSLKQLYFSENENVDGIFAPHHKKKKYKLRLTSKGSGKKIDINFSYEKKNDIDV